MAKKESPIITTSSIGATTDAERLVNHPPVNARRVREGAQVMVALMDRLQEVSNETCSRLGDEKDGRDYKAMALDIAGTFLHCLSPQQDHDTRLGFIRALTDFLAVNADGCRVELEGWEPLRRTEFAFSGRLDASLRRQMARDLSSANLPEAQHG